jgi:hypothetical protein
MDYNNTDVAYDLTNGNAAWYDSLADDIEDHGYASAFSSRWGNISTNQLNVLNDITSDHRAADVAGLRRTASRLTAGYTIDMQGVDILDTSSGGPWYYEWNFNFDIKKTPAGYRVSVSFKHRTTN